MKYLLDTNIVLYFLRGDLIDSLPVGQYYLSFVSEMELLSYPELDDASARKINSFLEEVAIVELSSPIKSQAVKLRKTKKLKLSNAIIAATAIELDASLLTNDKKILEIDGLKAEALELKGGV